MLEGLSLSAHLRIRAAVFTFEEPTELASVKQNGVVEMTLVFLHVNHFNNLQSWLHMLQLETWLTDL